MRVNVIISFACYETFVTERKMNVKCFITFLSYDKLWIYVIYWINWTIFLRFIQVMKPSLTFEYTAHIIDLLIGND